MKLVTVLTSKSAFEVGAKSIVFFVPEKFSSKDLPAELKKFDIDVHEFLAENKFTGAAGSLVTLPVAGKKKEIIYLCFAGIGSKQSDKKFSIETLRRAIGSIVKFAMSKKFESMVMQLGDAAEFGVSVDYFVEQVTIISYIASYKFDKFITSITQKDRDQVFELGFAVDAKDLKEAKLGLQRGEIIGHAVNNTRDLVDMPPSQATPKVLASYAEKVAKEERVINFTVSTREKWSGVETQPGFIRPDLQWKIIKTL